jgi:hypothetical protein
MTRQALDVIRSNDDVIIYIDYDLSWDPPDLLKLLETEGEVIAGTYRTKEDGEHYMGAIMTDPVNFTPAVRADGCIRAMAAPAGIPQDHRGSHRQVHDPLPRPELRTELQTHA